MHNSSKPLVSESMLSAMTEDKPSQEELQHLCSLLVDVREELERYQNENKLLKIELETTRADLEKSNTWTQQNKENQHKPKGRMPQPAEKIWEKKIHKGTELQKQLDKERQ